MGKLKKMNELSTARKENNLVVCAIIAGIADIFIQGIFVDIFLTQQSNWIRQVLERKQKVG